MGKKASQAQHDERLGVVEELLVKQFSSSDIVRYCKKKYDLAPRSVAEYITKVYTKWREESKEDRQQRRERSRRSILAICRKAVKANDFKSALFAESLLARLEGTRWDADEDGVGGEFVRLIPRRKPPKPGEPAQPAQPQQEKPT